MEMRFLPQVAVLVLREAGTLAAELQVLGRLGRHPNLTRLIAVINKASA